MTQNLGGLTVTNQQQIQNASLDQINATRAAKGLPLFTPELYNQYQAYQIANRLNPNNIGSYSQESIAQMRQQLADLGGANADWTFTNIGSGMLGGAVTDTNTVTNGLSAGTPMVGGGTSGGATLDPIDFEGEGVNMTSRVGTPFMDAYVRARESAQAKGPVSGLFAQELGNQ